MRRNILLLSEKDFLTLPIVRSADGEKYTIFVMGPALSAGRFSRYIARYFPYSGSIRSSTTDIIHTINALAKKYDIKAIIPVDLETTLWLSENKSQLNIPSFPVSKALDISRIHDKWELTKVLDTCGLPYPKTLLIEEKNKLVDGIMDYPFMMKPLELEAGIGIVHINNSKELERYTQTRAGKNSYPILVQKYVPGYDVGMSIIAVDGIIVAWTTQKRDEKAVLTVIDHEEAYAIGEKIIQKEKYSGFMHIDFQMDRSTGKVFVLECNPRTWSSINASILSGADFLDYAVRVTLSEPIEKMKSSTKTYLPFYKSFRILLFRPWEVPYFSDITKKDLISVLTDPMPYLILAVTQSTKKFIGWIGRIIYD